MREIELESAQATLDALVDDALANEPTTITLSGDKVAVILSYEDYLKLPGVRSFHQPLPGGDLPARES